jgi:energy-coupling factor transporter ATP-binding protein EcfA2
MEHITVVLDRLQHPAGAANDFAISTGFADLDRVARRFARGQLWAVVGHPDTGKTTLAVQWANALAPLPTLFMSFVEPPELIAEQALASLARLPRDRLDSADVDSVETVERARTVLQHSQLHLEHAPGKQLVDLRDRYTSALGAVVVDDVDLLGDVDAALAVLRTWCDERGYLVIVTCPREKAFTLDRDGVERPSLAWSRAVDVTVETSPAATRRPGGHHGADQLRVRTNRWGPLMDISVAWSPQRSRIDDLDTYG